MGARGEPAMKAVQLLCCIALCALVAPVAAQMTATKRTTSDGRPLASSLPPKAGNGRVQPHAVPFEELRQHVGANIVVTTIYGDRREGKVDSISGSTLRLRTSAGLGYAVTNFERGKIRSVTLLN